MSNPMEEPMEEKSDENVKDITGVTIDFSGITAGKISKLKRFDTEPHEFNGGNGGQDGSTDDKNTGEESSSDADSETGVFEGSYAPEEMIQSDRSLFSAMFTAGISSFRIPDSRSNILFFDCETVPDWSIVSRMGLRNEDEESMMFEPSQVDQLTVAEVNSRIKKCESLLTAEWAIQAIEVESMTKNRKGVLDALQSVLESGGSTKKYSVDTDCCRPICFSMAFNDLPPMSLLCDTVEQEMHVLPLVCNALASAETIVGANVIDFDLQVVKTRCVILGIDCPFIDKLSPFELQRNRGIKDILQIWYGRRIPKGRGQKFIEKLLHIKRNVEDVDGSKIYELYRAGDARGIADYCEEDVIQLRNIWNRLIP